MTVRLLMPITVHVSAAFVLTTPSHQTQLPTSVDNATLLAFAAERRAAAAPGGPLCRSTSPAARRAHSSKPPHAAAAAFHVNLVHLVPLRFSPQTTGLNVYEYSNSP